MTLKIFITKSKQKQHTRISKKGKPFFAGHEVSDWHKEKAEEVKDINRKIPNKQILFHWTDIESIEEIASGSEWQAGSTTTNPAFRFGMGDVTPAEAKRFRERTKDKFIASYILEDDRRFGLLFDRTMIPEKVQKEVDHLEEGGVPYDEWEVYVDQDISLSPGLNEKTPFKGFVVRTSRDAERIRNTMGRMFGMGRNPEEKDLYDVFLLKNGQVVRYNNK